MAVYNQKKTEDVKLLRCLTGAHSLGSGSNKREAIHSKAI